MRDFDNFIQTKLPHTDLWNYLKSSDKPIVLYGMGDGADKIIAALGAYGLTFSDVFASDEFVRGHSFHGHKVLKYAEISEKYDRANILVCFAARTDELISRFAEIGRTYDLFAPDVPVIGGGLFTLEYFKNNEESFRKAYNLFGDEKSREVYENIILYKLSGKTEFLTKADSDRNLALKDILKLNETENYLDLGAYIGDTVDELLEVCGGYSSILACEPDIRSYNKLYAKLTDMKNATALNCGIGNYNEKIIFSNKAGRMSAIGSKQGRETEFFTIDSICENNSFIPTYIKMDLEGEERAAIEGAEHILKYKPKLLVSSYHRNCDLYDLPILINSINCDYKLYLRKHKYIPAWDINIYAI